MKKQSFLKSFFKPVTEELSTQQRAEQVDSALRD